MLQNLLNPQVSQRIQTSIAADPNYRQNGGTWGRRVADVAASHDELTELDPNVASAANILAQGATNVDTSDLPTVLALDRALRIKQSRPYTQPMVRDAIRLARNSGVSDIKQEFLRKARNIDGLNLSGVKITRGLLIGAAATGVLAAYSHYGYVLSDLDLGMDASLKVTPTVFWRTTSGTNNVLATPLTDMDAADTAAIALGGRKYTDVDMTPGAFRAMVATNEFKSALAGVYGSNVPVLIGSNPAVAQIAGNVLGRRIHIVEDFYRVEVSTGTFATRRYVPEEYTILWYGDGSEDSNAEGLDFANVEVTESAIAILNGSTAFSGDVVRGPVTYSSGDHDEHTHARRHAIQEGIPRRRTLYATARITNKGGA